MLYTPYAADGKDPGWHDARFHRVIPTIRPPTSGDCWWETSTKCSRNAGMSQDAAECASSPELAAEVSRKPEITDSFVKTRPFEKSLVRNVWFDLVPLGHYFIIYCLIHTHPPLIHFYLFKLPWLFPGYRVWSCTLARKAFLVFQMKHRCN